MLIAYFVAALVVFSGTLAFLLFLISTHLARRLRLRERIPPRIVRAGRILGVGYIVLGLAYVLVVVGAFLWQRPWRDESHWKNVEALKLEESSASPPSRRSNVPWTVERLLHRLEREDTLVAVSLSGGGSRAAYFAAAALERLSAVRIPGQSGPGSSLVNHIALLSAVSGGSIAGAYFSAHVPTGARATDAELFAFFQRFKAAMATDFERDVGAQIVNPLHTLAFLTGQRATVETLAEVFDRRLFGGRNFTFAELLRGERETGAPLLVINATDALTMDLFAFTKDRSYRKVLVPTQRPDAFLGRSTEQLSTWDYRQAKDLVPFEESFGDLHGFRVADAVAASAAYPLLGVIRLHQPHNLSQPTLRLADAGLFDNSGLVSLYAHLLQRPLFSASAGRLKRMLIIAIDGTLRGGYEGPIGFVSGIYDLGQQHVQQLVVPEMIRRATVQELADLLDEEAWRGFQISAPREYSYLVCSAGDPVATKFRLTETERSAIEKAAASCVMGDERSHLTKLLEGKFQPRTKYAGVLGPADLHAWRTLFGLANDQHRWRRRCGRFATLEEIRAQRGLCRDGPKFYPVPLDFKAELDLERTGFVFESQEEGGKLRLYATPSPYRKPGRVSVVVELTEELMRADSLRFCLSVAGVFRGGDRKGAKASLNDPLFIPYGFHTYQPCI